ncbi:uncharacterized protein LOC131842112 [Achroia grisella]|uniref:uncharacterized protein LOC131842112 n=1 Tax=Achroia grisella TaxID=688607 RepID=UPI0027D32139|nr:uncharacterized protein LOC131842112 [Achroia grisella]
MKHNIECITDLESQDASIKGIVKWSHIEQFYNQDKNNANFVYAPVLTDHHIHPNMKQQMRVKLAAQVFSHSVAAGILAKIASNELPNEAHATATFVKKMDDLFDSINADSPDLRRGKKYSCNLTMRSPHLALYKDMRKFISSMKYLSSRTTPPSQDGWIQTLNAIERLWNNLQVQKVKSLSTRRLNQDPLENCFGCIRYHCGSNTNPTISQFVAGIKTAIITNLRHSGQNTNCEDDSATLANNLLPFLTSNLEQEQQTYTEHTVSADNVETLLANTVEAMDQATPEGQACAYICGFIFKKLRHNECKDCLNIYVTKNIEAIHIFTSFKEYETSNTSLNYINKNVVVCVEKCAIVINNYLKNNAHTPQIRTNIMTSLGSVDFSFLNTCVNHFESNKRHIQNSIFYICVKRYIIIKNREMDEDEKKRALERKMKILQNK